MSIIHTSKNQCNQKQCLVIENSSARDKGFKKERVGNKIGDVG